VGLVAPAKTPKAILDRLNTELNAALNDPGVREKLAVSGIGAAPGTPDSLGTVIRTELATYGSVIKAANIRLE
jgi:tripartite-type tricarboxylate transporter receptor subunit TctC